MSMERWAMSIDAVGESADKASIDVLELLPSPAGLLGGVSAALGILFGALGVALAAPMAAVGAVAIKRLYIEDILESGEAGAC